MKRFAIACSALFILSFHATAQTYLNCDFEDGMPSTFTLIDNDGNTPSDDATKKGFAVGTPWLVARPQGEKSNVAMATSWYSPNGTSDDWMITPAFTVNDDNVRLSWRARSSMKSTKYHEDYSVYVSTTGGTAVADFDKSKPLATVKGESYDWTTHSVDLSAYKGKTITVAFVDESNNKAYLYLDDINASVWSNLTIKNGLGSQVYSMLPMVPKATVTNRSDKAVDGFTVTLDIDGQKDVKTFDDTLAPGETKDIELDDSIRFGHHETKDYTLTVADNSTSYSDKGTMTSYGRKVLGEEYTGTWCSWCVRGIVAMNKLHAQAKDWFVGIAAHSDVMSGYYTDGLFGIWTASGYPSGFINRKDKGVDPGKFETEGLAMLMDEPVMSSLEVKADVPDYSGRTINTTTTLYFGADSTTHKFRLAYIIDENNVHHPNDAKYSQYNAAYSIAAGGTGGVMGGWEKLPKTVGAEDMWFHEVGRWYDTDLNGLDLLPTTIHRDEPIVVSHTLTIPDSIEIDTLRNCELVVLLIDGNDNHVVNAEKVALDSNAMPLVDVAARWLAVHGDPDGITDITATGSRDRKAVAFYTIDGRRTDASQKGMTIVKYNDGTTAKVFR